jgi:hypothetical protein
MRSRLFVLPLLACFAAIDPAYAGDAAMAETLFREGKALMDQGKYEEACAKLAESHRVDPASGTLAALALCNESQGKTATAWSEYVDAAALADKTGRTERAKAARDQAATLEPKLSRLSIVVTPATQELEGLTVKRDGVAIGKAAWGTAAPVDPGEHVIEAAATGKKTWTQKLYLEANADKKFVTVPELEALATASNAQTGPAPEPAPAEGQSGTRTVGFVVGGVGIVALGVGAIFGLSALFKRSDADKLCPSSPCSNSEGVDDSKSAKSTALVADILMGVGIVATGVGAYLVLRSPSQASTTSAKLAPLVRRDGAGLAAEVTW